MVYNVLKGDFMIQKYSEEEFIKARYRDKLLLECVFCKCDFLKHKNEIMSVLRGAKNVSCKFCSRQCFFNYKKQNSIISVKCNNCNIDFIKKKTDISKNNYCSRTCSITKNNQNRPKKIKVSIPRTTIKPKFDIQNYTIQELINKNWKKSSIDAQIRTNARKITKKLDWKCCKKCGYNKHIEISHIEPIRNFDLDTKISNINDIGNLQPLCPNCHWEFDNL